MPKPIIWADNRPPAERFDPALVRSHDPSYIPGYSELVQANEIAEADDLAFMQQHAAKGSKIKRKEDVYKIIGTEPRELDCELSWQRISGPNGADSYSAAVQLDNAAQEGWRPATPKDLDDRGFGKPPTATFDGDLIRRKDTALYIRDGEVSRKWKRYRAEQARLAEGASFPETLQEGAYVVPTFFKEEERETRTFTSKE